MTVEESPIAAGTIIEWRCPQQPQTVHRWRVASVTAGAEGHESLIGLDSLTHKPGCTGPHRHHPRVYVPDVLLRGANVTIRNSEGNPQGSP